MGIENYLSIKPDGSGYLWQSGKVVAAVLNIYKIIRRFMRVCYPASSF